MYQTKSDKAIFEQAVENKSKEFKESVYCEIEECYNTYEYEIVDDVPLEIKAEVDRDDGLEVYINQYRNGGYSGDDFGGQIWIDLQDGRFLTFHYSM
jgi:hypothetical protein